jgi:uncharacterized protein
MSSSSTNHQVGHFEIPADNVESLKSFYSSLFGWQFEKGHDKKCWNKWSINTERKSAQLSTQFVRVESIEDYVRKAKQLGARVLKDKQEISEKYYAVLEDPQKKLDRYMAR